MSAAAALSVVLALASGALEVQGEGTCPAPGEVVRRIRTLSPRVLSGPGRLTATLARQEAGLLLTLRGADGGQVAQRLLTGSGDCDALAAAASVVLVSWAREFASAGEPSASPPPQMPQADLAGSPPPLSEPILEPAWPVELDVSAGLSASVGAGSVAMGGLVTGALTGREGGWGAGLTLAALGARTEAGAATSWERFAAAAGPHFRLGLGPARLDLHAGLVAAVLSVIPSGEGAGMAAFDPGAQVGLRVLSRRGLWAGVQGVGWLRERALPSGAPLPRFEVLVTFGLAWSHP